MSGASSAKRNIRLGLDLPTGTGGAISVAACDLRKAGLIALPDLHHLRIVHRSRLGTESGG